MAATSLLEPDSIMGQGGGMFRSTDNGDTWTEQNTGFTARDVNAVWHERLWGTSLQVLRAEYSGLSMRRIVGAT